MDVEFLSKFERRGIRKARVNSIRITKSVTLLDFCTLLWSVVTEADFPYIVHLYRSLCCDQIYRVPVYFIVSLTHECKVPVNTNMLPLS